MFSKEKVVKTANSPSTTSIEGLVLESSAYEAFIETSIRQTIKDLKNTNSKAAEERVKLQTEIAKLSEKVKIISNLEASNLESIKKLQSSLDILVETPKEEKE